MNTSTTHPVIVTETPPPTDAEQMRRELVETRRALKLALEKIERLLRALDS